MAESEACAGATSKLATKEHWEDVYASENVHFDAGACEEWFEDECDALVDWICEHCDGNDDDNGTGEDGNGRTRPLIDLGCGNGLFMFRLAAEGFTSLYGIDYVAEAIVVAEKQCRTAGAAECCAFQTFDIRTLSTTCDESGSGRRSSSKIREGWPETFSIIHDKGTFDVFYMAGDVPTYLAAVSHLARTGTLLIVTSCNCTADELVHLLSGPAARSSTDRGASWRYRDKMIRDKMVYGGCEGERVSTCKFVFRDTDESEPKP
eukprot:GHVU01189671.1.p1 GENE.GHVU01189671.1~~GHVU01189671.1.p1  ORF type:complete len:263 (+),score=34.11 GHVU01189671.1:223-1011(+)